MAPELRAAGVAVGLHIVSNLAHGVPHAMIPVPLAVWQPAFVYGVVFFVPLVALWLVWRGRRTVGATLLAISMAASLAFGAYFHYVAVTPDRVDAVPAGPWRSPFRVTALSVALTEAVGVIVGAWLAIGGVSRSRAAGE